MEGYVLVEIKRYLVPFFIDIIVGIIIFYITSPLPSESFILIFAVAISYVVLITVLLVSLRNWLKFHFRGMKDVLPSMSEGKGSTAAILKTVTSDFDFMGIAARKWMGTGDLIDRKIKEVGSRGGNLQFLLLNPQDIEAKKLSIANDFEESHVPNLIIKTLRGLKPYFDSNINIEVRLYNFMPIFRIAIVNNRKMYLGFFRPRTKGKDSIQLVLDSDYEQSVFKPFKEYFNMIWNDDKTKIVDLARVDDDDYINSLGGNI